MESYSPTNKVDSDIRRRCFNCGTKSEKVLFQGSTIPSDMKFSPSLDYLKCPICGSIFIDLIVSQSSLLDLYPHNYYIKKEHSTARLFLRNFYASRLLRLAESTFIKDDVRESKRVLEIGPGTGENLRLLLESKLEVYAIEPNPELAKAVEEKGVKVLNGFIDSLPLKEKFDFVILSHVIEHDNDPMNMLNYCYHHMSSGAQLYIETPNINSPSMKICGKYWGDLDYPRHLSLMDTSILENLVNSAKFKILRKKHRTLAGDIRRSLDKVFWNSNRSRSLNVFLSGIGAVLQIILYFVNFLLRTGDSICILAVKD